MEVTKSKRIYIILIAVSLFVLLFITAEISVAVVKNALIVLSGASAIIFQLLVLKDTVGLSKKIQGILLLIITIIIVGIKYYAN